MTINCNSIIRIPKEAILDENVARAEKINAIAISVRREGSVAVYMDVACFSGSEAELCRWTRSALVSQHLI